jgi:phosphatidate cytidylyltransferase
MINNNTKKRIFTSIILFSLVLLSIKYNYIFAYILIIFGILSLLEFLQINSKIFSNIIYKYFTNTFFAVYLIIFCGFIFYCSNILQLKIIVFLLLFGCIASDVGGFIVGKTFKGPKLTKISPNKTYSGAIGSFLFTFLILSIFIFIFKAKFSYNVVILSFFTSLSCQIGDLFFSFLKRKAQIKDTGNFLPGHGGILDRVDGMLFGIPVGFITLVLTY